MCFKYSQMYYIKYNECEFMAVTESTDRINERYRTLNTAHTVLVNYPKLFH